jgi:hypothetical protein
MSRFPPRITVTFSGGSWLIGLGRSDVRSRVQWPPGASGELNGRLDSGHTSHGAAEYFGNQSKEDAIMKVKQPLIQR